jgi:hypothetical protein
MYESGFQCVDETIDSTDFCDAHQRVVAFDAVEEPGWRKAVFRFVALLLLIIFLLPLLYTLRNLYMDPPAEAQEVW